MIDDDIRKALKVDPSPEFVARVRARVAEEPAPSSWRWSWPLVGAAALAAAVVVAVIVSKPQPKITATPDVASAAPVAQPFRAAIDDATPKPVAAGDPQRGALESKPVVSGFSRTVIAADPEILIDPRERQALLQLITGVRAGRVDLAAAENNALRPPMDLDPVTEIVIAPITIDPLAPLSGAEGVRP